MKPYNMQSKLSNWEKSLKNKNVILAGGSKGLGKYLTFYLKNLGVNLGVFSRNIKKSNFINQFNNEQFFIENVDICNSFDVDRFISNYYKKFKRIDGLIICAGVYGPMNKLENLNRDEFIHSINVNLIGTFNVIKPCIPIFKKQNYGRVVQLSGGGATSPMPQIYGYASSKAAVVRFVESIALENSLGNILINSVAPGALNTKMLKEVLDAGPDKVGKIFYEKALKQNESGGSSLENASRCISYLVSPENRIITAKLISAVWDPWQEWAIGEKMPPKKESSQFTLRREI